MRNALSWLLVVGIAAVGVLYFRPWREPGHGLPRVFHARVVDADGQPLAGAEVEVATYGEHDVVTLGGTRASVDDPATERRVTVRTDATGVVLVQFPRAHQHLVVKGVRKPGYQWVIDKLGYTHESRCVFSFTFDGYWPQSDNPTILALTPAADPRPVKMMSRGGRDQFGMTAADFRTNRPFAPEIPSFGPGAPATDAEDAARAEAWLRRGGK